MTAGLGPVPPRTRKRLSPFVRRVTVCFAVLFVLIWTEGIFAITQLARFDDGSKDAQVQGIGSATALGQLAANFNALRAAEATQLLTPDTADWLISDAERKQLQLRLTKNIRQYESLDSSDEQKRLFMKFLANWYAYRHQSQLVFDALATKEPAKAQAAFAKSGNIFDDANDTLAEMIRINIQNGGVIAGDLHGIYTSSLMFIILFVAGVSLLITGIVLAVAWHEER